jgi:hypothetical protein
MEKIIREVLEELVGSQMNIDSEVAREYLTKTLHERIGKKYYLFKKKEPIVEEDDVS